MYTSEELKGIIGKQCKTIRQLKKISQAKVADMLNVDWSNYGHIERGFSLPSVTLLFNLSEILGFSIDDLKEHKLKNEIAEVAKTMIDQLEERDLKIIIASLNQMLENKKHN